MSTPVKLNVALPLAVRNQRLLEVSSHPSQIKDDRLFPTLQTRNEFQKVVRI